MTSKHEMEETMAFYDRLMAEPVDNRPDIDEPPDWAGICAQDCEEAETYTFANIIRGKLTRDEALVVAVVVTGLFLTVVGGLLVIGWAIAKIARML